MRLKLALTALAAVAVAGCTEQAQPNTAPPAAAASSAPAAPTCASVFAVGKNIDITGADFACLDPDGRTTVLTSFRCNDGGHLWQVDASTGATAGYGFTGKPYTATVGEAASDPAYAAAYATCN